MKYFHLTEQVLIIFKNGRFQENLSDLLGYTFGMGFLFLALWNIVYMLKARSIRFEERIDFGEKVRKGNEKLLRYLLYLATFFMSLSIFIFIYSKIAFDF